MGTRQESIFHETEAPQASRELQELRGAADYIAPFEVVRRRVIDDNYEGRMTIDATVVIHIGNTEETGAARGVGVVHALDLALRKALLKHFPYLEQVRVTETYSHAAGESTEAEVVSIKKFSDGNLSWTTLATSTNSVEAGWRSLLDGYEWRIANENLKRKRESANPRWSQR
ncbi:MAG TPA: alpha-isopropylmalate synthase regulatory domain-containing protein [Candidatus Binataceae bacterium]|nr:alpha-isopropylmalate synthase regulatory domain-containing protein [Candidatus Binataceae bacterium]HTY55534.1 alpha-isopropylmalate synthase regulatory domain-containing protein [Candidatus Binataceae bacterium]